jgi:hypothetical protein
MALWDFSQEKEPPAIEEKVSYALSPEIINITVKDNTLGTFYFYIINVYLQAMI